VGVLRDRLKEERPEKEAIGFNRNLRYAKCSAKYISKLSLVGMQR
jgi:hypothetical protein